MDKQVFFKINNIEYYLKEVYLEYEQPELFSVCNKIGNQFLVMLLNEIDRKWLMVPISPFKLQQLIYGKISIRNAFVNPEMGYVTKIFYLNGQFSNIDMLATDIEENDLPLEDARLNWDDIPMPEVNEDLAQLANKRYRDVFDVRVISSQTEHHTINIKDFSLLLSAVHDLVTQSAKSYHKAQGKQRYLTAGCGLNYVTNYAGSFGVRFEGEADCDITGTSKLTPIIQQIFDLLAGKDSRALSNLVKENSLDVIKAYRKLLKFASDNEAALDFSFATPNRTISRNVLWEETYSRNTLGYLDELMEEQEKEEEFTGTLISLSKKQYRFGFVTADGENIEGTIDAPLQNRKFQVECRAKIKVKRSIKINKANETEEKIKLIGIEELEGKEN